MKKGMMKKINWGILGCAGIAEKALVPAIRESVTGVLYGIAARDEKRARNWAVKYGFRKSFRNYQELIADPEVDAVYNPLPNSLHAEWSVRAAEAGKHVLCEKPMAMNAGEVGEMIGAARKSGTLLMEGFMYKFHPQIEKALDIVRSGRIGNVKTVHSSFTFSRDFDKENYRLDPGMGGGALYDVGCYTISIARLIFGEEPLSAFARTRIDPRTGVDMTALALLEFPAGRFAVCHGSFEAPFQSSLTAQGDKGTLTLSRAFSAKESDAQIEILADDKKEALFIPKANMFARMVEHFEGCILRREPLRYPPEDAERNMSVIDACFDSARTGRSVVLRPDKPAPA